ncbi:hypothetical protein O181_005235 [Austropuccinia psidii MF-1]|uniref:Reverse transcriptase/retrotransposon-derived protein RNase H-like domain-containing protein n=1 Tax=Austropuccinia psidii MF-1 TaxID=1389203 RepID=A0A9Q3GFM6_9BASI|nr:hypothetical protein [Austropuccinia psidii MF-1]
MESYSHLPQLRNAKLDWSKIQDAQLMKTKPNMGKGYTSGNSCITEMVIDKKPTKPLLDPRVFCSCVGKSFHKTCAPNFEDQFLPHDGIQFNSSSNAMKAFGIFETTYIFPHINGNLRITVEFVVIKVAPVNLELEKLKSEQLNEADISLDLTDKQENELSSLLYDHREPFASYKESLGAILDHEADIILNIERLYTPLLKRPAYPERPQSREALEIHIKELLDLGLLRKVGHNEEVEITTTVIVAWHNGKYRIVGDFRALNTYTVPDRYPIPKIQITLTQISQVVYITTMDALKRFHQNVMTPRARKYLRIIAHCGVYEYLRMPFGIKNAPEHIYRLSRVWKKIKSVNIKISLRKHHFEFKEIKELGHVVSGYYRQHIQDSASKARTLYKLFNKDTVFEINVDGLKAFESLRQALSTSPLLPIPNFKLPFKLYINASGDGLGAAIHKFHILNDKPVEGPICFISREMKPTEARYGARQMECLFLVWALERLN